ncbi:MAG: DUF58 domain-containing protein [Desulfopila sp.]|jgi:uncharacterized protein (DUF58 family)|nr:DUF58 domain-containing protein [Desulfopila sp.]
MKRWLYPLYKKTESFKQWFASRFTPLGKNVLFFCSIAFFFGLNVQRSMIYQLFTATVCVLFFSYLFTLRLTTRLYIRRVLPQTCIVGTELRYSILVENRGERAEKGLFYREALDLQLPEKGEFLTVKEEGEERRNIFDRKMGYYRWLWLLQQGRMAVAKDTFLPEIPAGGLREYEIRLAPVRRGNAHLTGGHIGRVDPLGLCKSQIFRDNPENILILPRVYEVPQLFFQGARKYHQGGITAARDQGDSSEFLSLREYVPGDPVKHIDWKSTARTGKTIVKQYRDEYFSRYGLILDSFTAQKYSAVFEEAVSLAASILMAQDSVNSVLDLLFVENECVTCTMGNGLDGHQRMLEVLASVNTCATKPFAELAALVHSHAALLSGAIVILIDLDEERKTLITSLLSRKIPTKVLLLADVAENFKEQCSTLDFPITILEAAQVEEQIARL